MTTTETYRRLLDKRFGGVLRRGVHDPAYDAHGLHVGGCQSYCDGDCRS